MSLPVDTEMVSAEQLLQYLGDLILSQDSSNHKVPYHLDASTECKGRFRLCLQKFIK